MLSHSHTLMHSCSRTLQPSCRLAIVPPSSRIGKNQVTRCYFVLWLLVSSSLTLFPALSSSQAKAYAPSVTRFPFLLVQVFAQALIHRKYRWIVASGRQKGLPGRGGQGPSLTIIVCKNCMMVNLGRTKSIMYRGWRLRPLQNQNYGIV